MAEEQIQAEQARTEEYEIDGDKVMAKIKELIAEGKIRRISLRTEEGKTLIDVPLMIGITGAAVGAILALPWVTIGAIAALLARLKIVVERVE